MCEFNRFVVLLASARYLFTAIISFSSPMRLRSHNYKATPVHPDSDVLESSFIDRFECD
jgi:hypothetical protein